VLPASLAPPPPPLMFGDVLPFPPAKPCAGVVLGVLPAAPTAGTANRGGGGGGSQSGSHAGASGGSGVVILSVPTANYSGTTTGTPTVTTSGANTIIQFNASGSYTA